MNSLVTLYLRFLRKLDEEKPSFLIVGLARTCLAIGSLITLIFSSPAVLFDEKGYNSLNLNSSHDYVNLFFYFGFNNIYYYYIICIIILIIVISGYFPRYTGILHWIVSFSIFRSAMILEGGDQITVIITFLLIPLTLSDTRNNHWDTTESKSVHYLLANISWVLIRLQLALLYYQSGVEKIYKLEEWRNGTAIYYFFNDPVFGYSDWAEPLLHGLLLNGYIVSALTWGTLLLEIVLFGCLFMRKKKRARLLIISIFFHLGIAVLLGLVSFFFAMAGGLVLYLSSRKTETFLRKNLILFKKKEVRDIILT